MAKRKKVDLSNPEEIRKSKGENQTDFWARFGITQSGGSRYESGRAPARPTQLYENLIAAQADGTLSKLRRQLVKTRLLIIDDFGIGGIDVHLGPILLDIIDQQSMQGSLLITSQFPPEKWYDLFNDPTVADAILDRIVHRAHFMELKGESMRKVRAKKT